MVRQTSNSGGSIATPTGKPMPRISLHSIMMIVAAVAAFLGLTRVPMPPSLPTGPITRPPEFRLVLDKDSVLHITQLHGDPVEIRPLDHVGLFKVYGRPAAPNAPPGSSVEGRVNSKLLIWKQILINSGCPLEFPVKVRDVDPALNQPLYCEIVTKSADGAIKHQDILVEVETAVE